MAGTPHITPRPKVGSKAVAMLFIAAFFTIAALAHVWVRLQVVRLGYSISRQSEREKKLQQVHRKLQVERALLRNPERLERLARERLNLTMPDPKVIQALSQRSVTKRRKRPAAGGGAR